MVAIWGTFCLPQLTTLDTLLFFSSTDSCCRKMTFGRVSDLGQFIRESEPEPDVKKSKGWPSSSPFLLVLQFPWRLYTLWSCGCRSVLYGPLSTKRKARLNRRSSLGLPCPKAALTFCHYTSPWANVTGGQLLFRESSGDGGMWGEIQGRRMSPSGALL